MRSTQRTCLAVWILTLILVAPVSVLFAKDSTLTPQEERIRQELVRLPYYGVFDNLEFQLEGTKVTLRGEVFRPTLKTAAATVVERLEGVACRQFAMPKR